MTYGCSFWFCYFIAINLIVGLLNEVPTMFLLFNYTVISLAHFSTTFLVFSFFSLSFQIWFIPNMLIIIITFNFIVADQNKFYMLEPNGTHKFYGCKFVRWIYLMVLKLLGFWVMANRRYCWVETSFFVVLSQYQYSIVIFLYSIVKIHYHAAGKWRW